MKQEDSMMKVISRINDERINASNVLIEMSIGEYLALIETVVHKNEFQRKRVRSSKTVYALLKEDLKKGCVIPSLVIAYLRNWIQKMKNIIQIQI